MRGPRVVLGLAVLLSTAGLGVPAVPSAAEDGWPPPLAAIEPGGESASGGGLSASELASIGLEQPETSFSGVQRRRRRPKHHRHRHHQQHGHTVGLLIYLFTYLNTHEAANIQNIQ